MCRVLVCRLLVEAVLVCRLLVEAVLVCRLLVGQQGQQVVGQQGQQVVGQQCDCQLDYQELKQLSPLEMPIQ
jgi:hypothetical protein